MSFTPYPINEDDLGSNSSFLAPSQRSVKTYVDTKISDTSGYLETRIGNVSGYSKAYTDEQISNISGSESVFNSDITVVLNGGKTFGRYANGDTIPASGLTASQVIELAIVELIDPTVSLNSSPTTILLGQSGISNELTFSYTINNPGATLDTAPLEWKRANEGTWNTLASNPGSPYTHNDTNTPSNSNAYNYRYVVTDSEGSSATATRDVIFRYGNYFGYSTNTSLTTVAQIEALGNQTLSDSRSRTVNNVTAGSGEYTYYAYKSTAGDLTNIILDGASPILSSFTKQSDVSGLNQNGASVTYRVYRSNATQAFTNNTLAFS